MSLPADRTMPVVRARYEDLRHGWLVDLPGGVTLPARDEWEARDLVARHAPGSSIAYVRMTPEQRDSWKREWAARLKRPTASPVEPSVFHQHTDECGPEEVRWFGMPGTGRNAVYRACRTDPNNPIRWAD